MEGSWQKVSGRKQVGGAARKVEARVLTEEEITVFLATFKTEKCTRGEFHDARFCDDFHNDKDRRRNPYSDYHEPDDCRNTLEKMYHPAVFRTTYCNRIPGCPFGSKCSHAHVLSDLRERSEATTALEQQSWDATQRRERPTIAVFVQEPEKRNYRADCAQAWAERRIKPIAEEYELDCVQWFVLQRSDSLFRKIEEAAFEYGLGHVKKENKGGRRWLRLMGTDVESIKAITQALLCPPSPYFSVQECKYGNRVMSSLCNLISTPNGMKKFSGSDNVLLQPIDDERIRVVAVGCGGASDRLVQGVRKIIDFWVEREGYDSFTECGCCCESRNLDQGIACSNGHFYCSVEQCLKMAVEAQVNHIGARKEGLVRGLLVKVVKM
jgi:hypothetical protein